jgi:hypothetical protein
LLALNEVRNYNKGTERAPASSFLLFLHGAVAHFMAGVAAQFLRKSALVAICEIY